MKKIVVGITGATGAVFGIRLLQALQEAKVESHLVVSKWGRQTIEHETSYTFEEVCEMATKTYSSGDMGAAVSSGSFITEGMIVAPCSLSTLGAIAAGHGETLVHRAADVIMKERRRLVLIARETPLSTIHLENMLKLSRMGVTMLPPVPAFYNHPQDINDIVNHIVARALDQFGIPAEFAHRWDGKMKNKVFKLHAPD
ncbi:MAG: UbiX family flavin prenyltransferase [Rhodospirillales bacterium]|nr:UbiX family flavin prenyltransferase [Rhodospirillales bacterium]